ncbi:MAG: response regulator [Lachnospiraceae bacterium]|nr:response regulator [Lachnospiraceae bacterium]
MSEGNKKIVIVALQYSVIVKGVERKLMDAGYWVEILSEKFETIKDIACTTDLFLLYLPNDISNNLVMLERLISIHDMIKTSGRKELLVGEANDQGQLRQKNQALGELPWISRPIEMSVLGPAIEGVISGKDIPGRRKRLLIVDDDPSYAKMIREWIKTDFQIDIVTAGMQAITFLLKNEVDLILLDYEMPVVDGPQVLQMLRQEPVTEKIPVIFLTGIGTKEAVERVMALKPDGYILKSTTRDNLLTYLHGKLG